MPSSLWKEYIYNVSWGDDDKSSSDRREKDPITWIRKWRGEKRRKKRPGNFSISFISKDLVEQKKKKDTPNIHYVQRRVMYKGK